jgi:hypothetical protein
LRGQCAFLLCPRRTQEQGGPENSRRGLVKQGKTENANCFILTPPPAMSVYVAIGDQTTLPVQA